MNNNSKKFESKPAWKVVPSTRKQKKHNTFPLQETDFSSSHLSLPQNKKTQRGLMDVIIYHISFSIQAEDFEFNFFFAFSNSTEMTLTFTFRQIKFKAQMRIMKL